MPRGNSMLRRKITAAIIILAFAMACMGCSDGGGDGKKGRSASRVGAGKKKDKKGAKAASEEKALAAYTPEGSMKRDLTKMQDRERQQAQLVAQLRSGRNPDQARIQREEDKLYEMRGRVQEYDAALQRYEMASRARPQREVGAGPALIPDEMFQNRPVRNQTDYSDDYRGYARNHQPARSYAGLEGYRSDPVVYQDDRMTHAKLPLTYEQGGMGDQGAAYQAGYMEERERVVYNPMADNSGSHDDRQTLTGVGSLPPGMQNQAQSADRPAPNPRQFAGAPVGRARFPESGQRERSAPQPWETGNMYSENTSGGSSRQSVPDIYASRRQSQREETMWPAGTAMAPPANSGANSPQLKNTAVRMPEAERKSFPAPVAKPAAEKASAPKAAAPMDEGGDDVFNPDMFLGR